jgi:hypothetical protein
MQFGFIARHRGIWPVAWLCAALGVSRSGFHAWLGRSPSKRARSDAVVAAKVRASFVASDRTYGAGPRRRGHILGVSTLWQKQATSFSVRRRSVIVK